MIPVIFQIGIKLKRIFLSTNRLVKVKIYTVNKHIELAQWGTAVQKIYVLLVLLLYTNTMQTFKTLSLLKAEP